MQRRGERSTERGAAAVEFAIVLPLLIAILCGTIDWGYYFFTREIVVNASREGARVGTLQFAPGTDPEAQAKTAARSYLDATLGPTAVATIDTSVTFAGGACPATSSCVRITYTTGGAVTGFTGSFIPATITAYAEMRR